MREPAAAVVKASTAEETRVLGMRLGTAIKRHADACVLITLAGDLGAGKTTFVSGILRAFGITGAVRSPTYTLIEPYDLERQSIYHLDLYRLANAAEVEGLALRDLMQPGNVLIVEWPERAAGHSTISTFPGCIKSRNANPSTSAAFASRYRSRW